MATSTNLTNASGEKLKPATDAELVTISNADGKDSEVKTEIELLRKSAGEAVKFVEQKLSDEQVEQAWDNLEISTISEAEIAQLF